MRLLFSFINIDRILFLLICLSGSTPLFAQQTNIKDYVLFGGNESCPGGPGQKQPLDPGCAVHLLSNSKVYGGSIGSYQLVKSSANTFINSNIFSGGIIELGKNNTVTGKISAANSSAQPVTVLTAGNGCTIGDNIDVNGNIIINSGSVSGTVTHPVGSTYLGPVPGGGILTGPPTLPLLPKMPDISVFPPYSNIPHINSTRSIVPGAYNGVKLPGNKTLTFSGTGVYVFDKIDNDGGTNYFVFDFKNSNTGIFKIYVHNDADLDKISVRMINGGSATRIFTEVHGNGSTSSNETVCFNIANGDPGVSATKWLGTVWAPYAGINIGSGTGNSSVTGAFWSGTQVTIQSGAKIIYARYSDCITANVNAGPDKPLDFENKTTLNGSSTTPGVTYSWKAIKGGVIISPPNAQTITVSAAGTYILSVYAPTNCFASDTVIVTGKTNGLIGSELQSIFQNFNPNAPPSPFFVIQRDSIMIDIIAKEGQYANLLALLTTPAYGLTNIISNGSSNFIITGLFPINKLPLLNSLGSLITYCRPYYGPLNNIGIVTSAGDTSVRTHLVRNGYNLQGDGVKIGVISDSYNTILTATTNPITNTAAQDIGNGDLPGPANPNGNLIPVQVLQDYPFRRSDEGRAMLQIIHDLAPKAELYFRTGFNSPGDFAIGIQELKQAGCNIIVDDITYITEPFLKDGVVAAAVDAVANAGTTYFSAAGNFANKSYENIFNPVQPPAGLTGSAHNFGGGDVFQSVNFSPGNYTIVLQWLDDIYSLGQTSTGGTKNDLDIYLTPNTDGTALFGFNRNNINGDPIEIIPFTLTSALQTNILIINNTNPGNPARFKFVVFRGDITFNEYATGTSTLVGQANASGAIAIGAARYDKAPPFPGPLLIESFSSTGGTFINNIQRNKPELVAPDGVNTTVNLGVDYDNNLFSNFFGTSAAAPHAAGVAALIMEGRKKFSNQPSTPPGEIREILQSTATDMYTPGFDFVSGYGFINADSSMRRFASPTPLIDQLSVPSSVTPGTSPFVLTVKGKYLSYNSVIKFRDIPLATTILNSEEATALIPAFTGNPAISLFTPPISISGLDGGASDSLYFFNLVKKKITVTATNKTKKYAQQLPAFTATILVDGVPLQNTSITIEELGLANVAFVTQATVNSDVGTYIIIPARIFNPTDPIDIGLLEKYIYTFTTGTLTIEKMPLKVTPVDKTISFGEHIGEIIFRYEFDQFNVPDPGGITNLIKSYHNAFLPNNALAVIKDFSKPQSNGTVLTGADLLNMSMMASFQAVKNSRKFLLENNKLVPANNPTSLNIQYLVDISSQSIFNYKINPAISSFINAFPGINSKAILSANSLSNNTGKVVTANGSLVQMVNGSLVQMVNTTRGSLVPIINGSLVQIVNGSLVQLVNGEPVPIPNGSLVQIVNGSLVQLVNGELVTLTNGSLVQLVNGSLVQMVNGSLVQLVNGSLVPIINGSLVQIVNGQLVQLVNGSLVPIINGSLVQLVNGSLVQMVNGSLVPIINGSLVQLVNGSLVQIVNGSLVQIVNGRILGTGNSDNNTAVIFDEADVDFQTNWLGPMFGINMITGLNAGQQTLVPGVLVNENFEISYGLGKVNILPASITIIPTPHQSKLYGNQDPTFTYTINGGNPGADFTGKLGRVAGENVNTYAYTLGSLSAGTNYVLGLSTIAPIASFAIIPVPLTVKAMNEVILQGDPLPTFKTTVTGLKNGDNPIVSYIVSPAYQGAAGEYKIIPGLPVLFTKTGNYIISLINGTLQVKQKPDSDNSYTKVNKAMRPNENSSKVDKSVLLKTSLFPNPATTRIIIHIKDDVPIEKSMMVYDVNGRSCPVKISRRISRNSIELDVSGLQDGIYLIRLKVAESYRTFRFVKV